MAEKSVETRKQVVNPTFYLPEEVIGFEYQDTSGIEVSDDTDTGTEADIFLVGQGEVIDDTSATIDAPAGLVIVSQTIRRAPGGQQVIDVVFEVEDVFGAINYETYITKM